MNKLLGIVLVTALAVTIAVIAISLWKETEHRHSTPDDTITREHAPSPADTAPSREQVEASPDETQPTDNARQDGCISIAMEFADEYAPSLRWLPKARGDLSKTPPASVRVPPRKTGCLFGEIRLGCGAIIPFALIKPEGDERAASFIVDLNFDGDLSNDGPAGFLKGTGTSLTAMQPLIELPLPDGSASRIRLWLWTTLKYPKSGDDTGTFNFYIRSFMRGQLRLPGEATPFLLAVMDHEGNGHYSSDKLFIDWNRNRRVEDEVEWLNAGESVRYGNNVFRLVEILPGARKVILEIGDADANKPDIREQLAKLPIEGNMAPNFDAVSTDGRRINLLALRGKVVLLDFWASWCGPCRKSIPEIKTVHAANAGSGFEIIGISLDTDAETAQRFCLDNGMSWPQICSGAKWADPIAKLYNAGSIPHTVLIAPDGRIAAINPSTATLDQTIRSLNL